MDKPRVRVGVGVIIFKDGKILLGKRRGAHGAGEWALPGGKLDMWEELDTCARRETKEETGIEISDIQKFDFTNDMFLEDGLHYITCFMTAHWQSGRISVMEPDKCAALSWFTLDHLPSPLFLPLEQLLKERRADIEQLMRK